MQHVIVDGHSLFAVPAVHNRMAFAVAVNRACAQCATRPDAIAVELGHAAVLAVSDWLGELGAGRGKSGALPCLLGLVTVNRRIHPNFKRRANFLQEETGKHIQELGPSLLWKLLRFSPVSLLPLSPTDSIIEAIRCAIELGVPLYGVDLDDYCSAEPSSLIIQDPLVAHFATSQYVERNAAGAEQCVDELVDRRRELVMASRLKAILRRHQRVLFTGGLAHWNQVQRLLLDPKVRPAAECNATNHRHFDRVLVHPTIAYRYMEILPTLTALYEKGRQRANVIGDWGEDLRDVPQLLCGLLNRTYEQHFGAMGGEQESASRLCDRAWLPQFERSLTSFCLMGLRSVPSLSDLLQVAQGVMSADFTRTLAEVFLDLPWASPKEFPELPILGPTPNQERECAPGGGEHESELTFPATGADGTVTYRRSSPFRFCDMIEGRGCEALIESLWRWKHEPPTPIYVGQPFGQIRVWPPNDYLLFGMAFRACQKARQVWDGRLSEPFTGSLLDGLDLKATMRSAIRGEARIYVRNDPPAATSEVSTGPLLDPTVFIFPPRRSDDLASWYLYSGSIRWNYQEHIKNRSRLQEVIRVLGDEFVQGVARAERAPIPPHLKTHVTQSLLLSGVVVFENPCLNAIQEASWLEETDYARAPIFSGVGMPGLSSMYRERHRIDLDSCDWATALILLALPYARRQVTVVAPDQFVIPAVVSREARVRRLRVALLPTSYFPTARIEEMRRRYHVVPEDKDGLRYSRELERLLEQPIDAYRNLLPEQLLRRDVLDHS